MIQSEIMALINAKVAGQGNQLRASELIPVPKAIVAALQSK